MSCTRMMSQTFTCVLNRLAFRSSCCSAASKLFHPNQIPLLKNHEVFGACFCHQAKERSFQADQTKTTNFTNKGDNTKTRSFRPPRFNKSNILKDERSLLLLQDHDPDVFGTLSDPSFHGSFKTPSEILSDDEDGDNAQYTEPILEPDEEYPVSVHQLKRLVQEGKLKEALEMFQNDIVKERKDRIILPMYVMLIGECGRAGYTKMAFKLFRQMKDRGFRPTGATITALFNACAESPFPEYGLKKAYYLCTWINEKGFCLNSKSYHAMLKAFGRCGDLEKSFQIIDEMMEQRLPLSTKTFSFLLMACISDKEAGLAHAIQVIRKMRKYRIARDGYIYNLLLRATRDCNVGPPEVIQQLLDWGKDMKPPPPRKLIAPKPMLSIKAIFSIEDGKTDNEKQKEDKDLVHHDIPEKNQNFIPKTECDVLVTPAVKSSNENKVMVLPNLLSPYPPPNTQLLELKKTETPEERLALLGGLDGVLSMMAAEKVQPNIKTFSLLLEMIPNDLESEKHLLQTIYNSNTKPDVDFFNLLIKRRMFRSDFNSALDVLLQINNFNLYPDIVTFGVLATGCSSSSMAKRLISDMKNAGFQPNIEIMGAFMKRATFLYDFWYVIDIMNMMKSENIKPDPKLLDMLEKARTDGENVLISKEKGQWTPPQCRSEKYDNAYRTFRKYYKHWLQNIGVEIPQHPWKQYTPEPKQSKDE